ncbi:MAG: efflux RND transporter permease subunit [Thermodesulfobacteriota bacterium]
MNPSEIFIRRPVMTTLVMLSILLFGLMAYRRLPVSDLPNVDFPTILVSASLPGASPETMAAAVATPLEKQFSTIAGVSSMSSYSLTGISRITLQFDLDRNLDAAAQDVQAAIARTASRLPKNMPYPPSYRKVNPADQPILYIALTSPTLPLYALTEYGDTLLAQRISMITGVAQVMVFGSQKYAVRIKLDPKAMAAKGLGLDEVARSVAGANSNLPTGSLDGRYKAMTVETTGQLTRAADYNQIIVAYRNGRPVRLSDVGRALDGVEADKVAAWFVDQRGMILAVQRQPGTNTVEVTDAVKKVLPTFREKLPASVNLEILYDRSESIRDSVNDVKFTLVFTLLLVVVVIFLFLRNMRVTIIPSVAMPMSIIGTFSIMYLLGYSLDNLSLMALVLCVGFVVDDAIVMLENIIRHIEMGEKPFEAALNGSREVSFTIVSMTLSLAAVFIPVLFMGGIIGRLFNEFSVTIGVAVLVSGTIALTLTPMLSARFLKETTQESHGRFYRWSEKILYLMIKTYAWGLRWFLRHRALTMLFTLIVLAATVHLFQVLPKGFIPNQDTGRLMAMTVADQGISFESMVRHQRAAAELLKTDPDVMNFMSSVGSGGPTGQSNSGTLFIRLRPMPERRSTADQVIARLRPKLAQVAGFQIYLQNPPLLSIGGQITRSQYQYTMQSPDTDELYHLAPVLEQKIKALPGFTDVTTDLQLKNPQVTVEIDRDKASALGLSAEQIEDALYTAYGSRQVSTIYAANDDYQVIMELRPEYKLDASAMSLLYVRSTNGKLVPLDAAARIRSSVGPAAVNHLGQLPSVTISFNLSQGASLGDAVQTVDRLAKSVLPPTISTSFQGTAQAFQSSMAGMGLLLVMAVLVIYIVLGILYESFIHPVTILSALPFAGFGALLTLLVFRTELNIYAFVGVIMLIGLVKKNGIMMIDFAIAARRNQGKSAADAIYDACLIRFRPIMMTTMAALVGTLPIALGYGAGGEARQPLGLAVVGGLLFSQFLTLFVTPVFYIYLETFSEWLGRRRREARRERIETSAAESVRR